MHNADISVNEWSLGVESGWTVHWCGARALYCEAWPPTRKLPRPCSPREVLVVHAALLATEEDPIRNVLIHELGIFPQDKSPVAQ